MGIYDHREYRIFSLYDWENVILMGINKKNCPPGISDGQLL